ncbi:hypothetical protein CCAX7_27000 [Capsulimonas corticalis]|uniref:Microcin J25-processing protein McjB C-terminal domain-containing protein n=1 Tax=Capsulimonas corticalis TaxID=2219043 RepID=A0A402CTR9_9BACT|nr:lasso peptide biosynthesis B2 protein [Capsulimonas corticalis]BDI30649.1 hypothetical protein CCAX7_27000 [Capsulimonas corticalis]
MTLRTNRLAILRRHGAKWRSLSIRDQGVYLRALALLAVIRIALWTAPFPWVLRWIERRVHPARNASAASNRDCLVCARAVGSMARYVPAATCLTQSLATFVLIKRLGNPASLKIGVAKAENGEFLAHAWVETPDGRCMTSAGPGSFQLLMKVENDVCAT